MIRSEEKRLSNRSERQPGQPRTGKMTVTIPGSSANLGPGFDTLGFAVSLYCKLSFEMLEENDPAVPLITLKGMQTHDLPADKTNLVYTVLSNVWKADEKLLDRVRITIDSQIPLGRGIGSSAAAIMGSVWAAYALTGHTPETGNLLGKATELEGHSDNVAACLLGGLVVSGPSENGRSIITQKVKWPKEWCPILVVPKHVLSTKKSRSVLPKMVSRQDAVYNVQRLGLLLSAVHNKDEDAMKQALHDRLHEPYRQVLVPELPALRKALSDYPVIGTVLSGAGSSVLTLVNQRRKKQVLECIKDWASRQPEPPDVLDLEVDQEGLAVG